MDAPKAHESSKPQGVRRRSWPVKFWQQFVALLAKNGLVAWRNLASLLLRVIIAPLIFIFLVFIINEAITTGNKNLANFKDLPSPPDQDYSAIPNCESDLYARPACLDFIYAPNNSAVVAGIVTGMRENNPGYVIPSSKVLGFASQDDMNSWMLANPEITNGAVRFTGADSPTSISFSLQVNTTTKFFKGVFQDYQRLSVPLQTATQREIARHYLSLAGKDASALKWGLTLRQFAHPATSTVSVVGQVLGPFLFAANMFGFVLVLSAVVFEREYKLRQGLATMGMMDSAYWSSWLVYELLMGIVTSLFICAFGAMFQFDLFLKNDFQLLFTLFFLFQLAMAALAFFFSTMIKRSAAAVSLGFVVFLIGWLMQLIVEFGYPYTPDNYDSIPVVTILFSICPWSTFVKALTDLGNAAANTNPGLTWDERDSYCKNLSVKERATQSYSSDTYVDYACYLSVGGCYRWLIALFFCFFLLAMYLDNVLPNESGVAKPLWFLFLPSYWWPRGGRTAGTAATSATATHRFRGQLNRQATRDMEGSMIDEDVAAEERAVREMLALHSGRPGPDSLSRAAAGGVDKNAVEIFGLQRVFKGTRGCCSFRRARDFWAIKGTWLSVEKNQLFCLLGPNGAGKSTTINCLTGVLPPSGGDALVYGQALSAAGGMDTIRSIMGVCPQFDILWNELTGAEHMWIYGNVKGIPRKDVVRQGGELLAQVRLTGSARLRTGSYSGGMKRRLSVAIALLGDPKIVYLDEPTTGMDPISRRHVWDIIEAAKTDRAIVLTTHSMEEADILGDRIGIMARGRLRCLGSSLRLKQKFGSGYQLSISTGTGIHGSEGSMRNAQGNEKNKQQAVVDFVKAGLGVAPFEQTRAYVQFLVPRAKEKELRAFLLDLEAHKDELFVTDTQISLTSLEEVFLTIARTAEMEAAAAEGRSTLTVNLENGLELKVPIGEEYVVHPSDGVRYKIKWAQDENGSLQILSWTPDGHQHGSSAPDYPRPPSPPE